MVGMAEPYAKMVASLRPILQGLQVLPFIFETPPKPFDTPIVHPAAFSIHRDGDPVVFPHGEELKCRQL